MKKLILTALIAVSIVTGSYAQDVNKLAVENFESAFQGASNVEWASRSNFTIASFIRNDSKVEVFYNSAGDFIATTEQIEMKDAPTYAKRVIAKKYSDYIVKEAFMFKSDDEKNYFISLENQNENLVLSVKQGSVSIYSRTSKI